MKHSMLVLLFFIIGIHADVVVAGDFPVYAGSFGELKRADMYPVDLAVDNELNLYIIDELNFRIQKRTADNEAVLIFGSSGNGDGQFSFPRGITLDAAGNIYVSDCIANRIQKFDSSGNFLLKWGAKGSQNGELNYPTGMIIGSDGFLYVCDRLNHRIQVFNDQGDFIKTFGDGALQGPEYIAIDPSGCFWVTDIAQHTVAKFSADGHLLFNFGGWGTLPGQFKSPMGIVVDSDGLVFVYDRWNGRIQKFDFDGNFIVSWGEFGSNDGQLHGLGLAIDEESNIYIADYWNYRIQQFSPEGEFLKKWTGAIAGDGQFAYAHDLVVNSLGKIYIVDRHHQKVQVFDRMGNFLFSWGSRGLFTWNGPFFNFPRAIAVDNSDNLYISNDNDIRIFNELGEYQGGWRINQTEVPFSGPLGMAFDHNQNLFYTTNAHNVFKCDTRGNIIKKWGTLGNGEGQFNKPTGLAVDKQGNVYVCDMLNYRVQKFTNDGEFLTSWGGWGYGDGLFLKPMGIAVDPSGIVYVVDILLNQVQTFDVDGNYLSTIGGIDPGDLEFNRPHYVATDITGKNIYVTDSSNGRVVKLTHTPVSVHLTPLNEIVNPGGELSLEALLTNETDKFRSCYFATNATLPDGRKYPVIHEALYGPEFHTLAPGSSIALPISHEVPINAQIGPHQYHGYTGKGLFRLWDESHFDFTVTN